MALRRTSAILSQLKQSIPSTTNMSSSSLKPVICYTAATPNGQKVHIMIEELKEAYKSKTGFDAEYKIIQLGKNEQKEDCE